MAQLTGYWIDPSGRILDLGAKTHVDIIIEAPERFGLTKEHVLQVYAKHQEPVGVENRAREELIKEVCQAGFIRIRLYRDQGWSVNVGDWHQISGRWLGQWAKEAQFNRWAGRFAPVRVNIFATRKQRRFAVDELVHLAGRNRARIVPLEQWGSPPPAPDVPKPQQCATVNRKPAPACSLCRKPIEAIGGFRLIGTHSYGIWLSDRHDGGGNPDYPKVCVPFADGPAPYLVVQGPKGRWLPESIEQVKSEYRSGLRPWFCEVCAGYACRICGSPMVYPGGAAPLSDNGCSSHIPIFAGIAKCCNPDCENFKDFREWGALLTPPPAGSIDSAGEPTAE